MQPIWHKSYQSGVPTSINPDDIQSLVHLFHDTVDNYQSSTAFSNFGVELSYSDLSEAAHAFAAFLHTKLTMVKGERVAIMLPNCLQYPIAMYGSLLAGMTVVNANPMYTPKELSHQLLDSEATTIVVLENFAHVLEAAIENTQIQHVIVTKMGDLLGVKGHLINFVLQYVKKQIPQWTLPGSYTFKSVIDAGKSLSFKPPAIVGDDIAFLQYTGGTTGVAKGAVLSHRNIIANVMQARAWIKPLGDLRTKGGVITALPLYHIFSLTANCIALFEFGIENILITNPRDMKGFIKELGRKPFCALSGVNTLFNGLLRTPGFDKLDFSHFKLTLGGGMAVQRAVAEKWEAVTGVQLIEAYGLTECSPAVSINPLTITAYNGSIGLPLPSTDIRICNDEEQDVPAGEPGELCIKGPQVMQGYWKRPDETKLVFTADGYLKTGDVATVDEKGFVRIVDRKKDMILVSGFNVYPNEIEDVIALHPKVKEVAVVGIPVRSGEQVVAYVVKSDLSLSESELLGHCKASLTNYKVPKKVVFKEDLPKTNVGKVLRRALRDEAVVVSTGEFDSASEKEKSDEEEARLVG